MEQQFLNHHASATFASPATPNQEEEEEERGVEMIPKGWSSERVPLSKNSYRSRHVASSTVALFPFSSGRTLPSKWDDAERWISSPIFGQEEGSYSSKSLQLVQSERRAKSKSGPLGPQMLGNYGNYSPVMPVIFGGGSVTADSPLLGPSNNSSYGGRRNSCPGNEQDLASTREWLKLLHEPPGTESQDEKSDGVNGEEDQVRRVGSRRDMGTQMLPSEGSSTTSYSSPPPAASNEPPEMDEMVRDVKVDKDDTLQIRRSINQIPKSISIPSASSRDYNNDSIKESHLPPTSKLQSQRARINDWENLQREKAEAAIQKLEMKLEKKRSSSMEKIMKKLKRAELKAETMRSERNVGRNQVGRETTQRIVGLYRRIRMGSIANCLACR